MWEECKDMVLLQSVAAGDKQAFRLLFDRYFTPLCRFMYLFIKDREQVEELAVDIFMHLWTNRGNLGIRDNLKSYIFCMARNKCLNIMRKKKRTVWFEEVDFDIYIREESLCEAEELMYVIEEAVCRLPEKCREVFRLSREQGMPNREVAEKLNISVKTVEGQITKALKSIREQLVKNY